MQPQDRFLEDKQVKATKEYTIQQHELPSTDLCIVRRWATHREAMGLTIRGQRLDNTRTKALTIRGHKIKEKKTHLLSLLE